VTTPPSNRLDGAELWMRDSLAVLRPTVAVHQVSVDMTNALRRMEDLRKAGVAATASHLLIHAAARALAANPDLHQIVCGKRRLRPARVDIGLSISGEIFVAPVLIIEGADQKTIPEIVEEVSRRVPEVREADRRMLRSLRRWGRFVPSGLARRTIMRALFSRPHHRRKLAGTFQISTVPVDWALTTTFVAAGVLVAGDVRSRVVVAEGQPAVRPTMVLTLSVDHGVWDGRAASRFLSSVKTGLEAGPTDTLTPGAPSIGA
jgi:pyruvate/2-oxoglutarate dehydrogenase complex dihydrolipoamide acyltransferase (E2) component